MAYQSPTWADLETGTAGDASLYVPTSWTANVCRNQASTLRAARFRLGCVFKDHASIGPFTAISGKISAALPSANCGW